MPANGGRSQPRECWIPAPIATPVRTDQTFSAAFETAKAQLPQAFAKRAPHTFDLTRSLPRFSPPFNVTNTGGYWLKVQTKG